MLTETEMGRRLVLCLELLWEKQTAGLKEMLTETEMGRRLVLCLELLWE